MANIEFVLCDKRLMSSDKNHPLDTGYAQLADYLAAYMKNGKIDVIRPREQLNTSARTSMADFLASAKQLESHAEIVFAKECFSLAESNEGFL